MATTYNYYAYVDGVETLLASLAAPAHTNPEQIFGIAANDSGVSRSLHASIDSLAVGSTAYGSTDILFDDFTSPGFPGWTYNPGSPTCLTQTGSEADLIVTGDIIGSPDIDRDVTVNDPGNTYILNRVKCTAPARPASASVVYVAGVGFVLLYSNAVEFNGGSSWDLVVPVALNDGAWHDVGMRIEVAQPAGPRYIKHRA